MLKFALPLLGVLLALGSLSSCQEDQTYGELREKENKQINAFLEKGCKVADVETGNTRLVVDPRIKVISEAQFYAQDSTTNLSANEYVLLAGSGVYMQIVRKGSGEPMKSGESAQLICRFTEYNIATDTLTLTNNGWQFEQWPDVMSVQNNAGTFTASFTTGMMYKTYGRTSVPSGWLMALPFIRVGRQTSSTDEIAKVRVIVPSTQGHFVAEQRVTPYFYEITYQKSR